MLVFFYFLPLKAVVLPMCCCFCLLFHIYSFFLSDVFLRSPRCLSDQTPNHHVFLFMAFVLHFPRHSLFPYRHNYSLNDNDFLSPLDLQQATPLHLRRQPPLCPSISSSGGPLGTPPALQLPYPPRRQDGWTCGASSDSHFDSGLQVDNCIRGSDRRPHRRLLK